MKSSYRAFLALGTLAAGHAVAQTAADAPERTLRPVVVTPTPGVAQAAFDTPASVDVIDGATIRDAQLQVNLSESLARVPGVVALNRQNYAQDLQISVRGFGARATFGVRGLRLYADGIPATAPDGQGQVSHFDLGSADRIEVLRGPFSVLYGNSSGGVISLFTADGGPRPVAEVGTAFGSDGVQRHTVRFSGSEGPWNYNVGAMRFRTDGFRDHSAAERTGFNGKVRYTASPDTRMTVVVNAMDMPDVQDPLGLTRGELEADRRQASPAALAFNTRKSVDQLQAGGIFEHRFDPVHSVKLTAWKGQRGTEQFQAIPVETQVPPSPRPPAPGQPGGVISLDRGYQGLDAHWVAKSQWLGRPFTLTAGLAADELDESRRGYRNFIGSPLDPTLGVMGMLRRDEKNTVRSFDQYLQGQWTTGRVSVTGGVRHSRVSFDSRDRYIVAGNGDDSGSARFEATTPAVGVVFHATDHLNLYASAGKGFETPTFNELSYRPGGAPGLNFGLGSADSRQWEIGLKAEPADNWRVNAALFQARTTGEIVVLSNFRGRSTFQNAGETRRRGLEAALDGRWGKGWSLHAAATWLDASYASSFLTCGPPPCETPSVSVAAGNRIPGIPRTTAFVELGWAHRPWGLQTALEFRHVGRIATDDQNRDFAPAANLWNLRVSLAQPLGRWTLREFVRIDNLANRRYVGSVIVNEGNQRYFEPAPGRTWLVGVNAAYAF